MKNIDGLFRKILPILPDLIVFIFSLYQPSDPDLGWHLKYGEYFWQHGTVLRDNIFSTMMPDFHWANTSWLTDIISYTAYHLGGLFDITLLGALVVTGTFYFFAEAFGLTLWEKTLVFPFVLYLEEPVNVISFRGQQLAIFFMAVLFYLISLYEERPKLLWLAVPLFLIWAAIDGEFVLGYALFGLWVVLYITKKIIISLFVVVNKKGKIRQKFVFSFEKLKLSLYKQKKEIGLLLSILVISFLATFINPFGYGIHLDAVSHIGNPLLKDISEYLPFAYLSQDWWNEVIVGIILIFGLFILGFRGKFWEQLPLLGGGFLLFLFSLQIRRYAWPSYYLLFPLLGMSATFLKPDGKKATKITTTILLFGLLLLAIWQRYPFTQFTSSNWNEYCQSQSLHCSPKSAEFLINHHFNHTIFSLYGWGGWLIWNYPQIKPTIDGRMHLWVQNGYSGFAQYYSLEQNFVDIDKTNYTVVYMSPDKPLYNEMVSLVKQKKWKQVYKDKYAGIFVKLNR